MQEFFSWLRYVEFDGDAAALSALAQKSDDSDCFKAKNIKALGLDDETKVWLKIDSLADSALSLYGTTYQEDLDLLAKVDQEKHLTYNQRKCILYRCNEKKILHFLKDTAALVARLTQMTQNDAKKELDQLTDIDKSLVIDYFDDSIFPNLPTQVDAQSALVTIKATK